MQHVGDLVKCPWNNNVVGIVIRQCKKKPNCYEVQIVTRSRGDYHQENDVVIWEVVE